MTDHQTCEAARSVDCVCGAKAGQACICKSGHYHLSRFVRARGCGKLSAGQLAAMIDDGVQGGMDTVTDPGAAA
jgi:hypothetical protein